VTDYLAGIREVMNLTFGIPREQVSPRTSRADVPEWDSVGHLNLMLGLEERFHLSFEVEDLTRLTSVAAILDYLKGSCASG
jgi:acyl carrier protein